MASCFAYHSAMVLGWSQGLEGTANNRPGAGEGNTESAQVLDKPSSVVIPAVGLRLKGSLCWRALPTTSRRHGAGVNHRHGQLPCITKCYGIGMVPGPGGHCQQNQGGMAQVWVIQNQHMCLLNLRHVRHSCCWTSVDGIAVLKGTANNIKGAWRR
jgi:hypothetical protein